ncbi:dipeptide/oligopeptide/nickel ABC transporter permease/ATP-binding protein [Ketogulonicigenium vulgare]|uniref:dipeptide/oligopeptide/nickel ABC transporter permease/ATP-binding protein n=1 Tax=Ketogulonicigenium vulgare TaxID=92945 RepID=UPI00235A38DB|nr:dipeptide/oligopeptide/nickel ABC transporter permease/ATP-binding protein [Ketogulonicigenium vulgare]
MSSVTTNTAERPIIKRKSYLRDVLTRPTAIIGLSWIVIVAVAAVFATQLSPYSPIENNLRATFQLPTLAHPLGTDQLGRDILSRLMHGAAEALIGSLVAVTVAVMIGLPLGLLAGYYGRWVNLITSRLADLLLTIPTIIVLLAVLAVFGNNMYFAMIALGIMLSAGFMRLATSTTQGVARELYVDAARVFGVRDLRILIRHVLPNMIGPIVVQTSMMLGIALLLQSGLSFLGLGARPPFPSWGQMVAEASLQVYTQPWMMVPAGLAIALTTLALNFIGDAARDALPQAQRGNLLASSASAPRPAQDQTPKADDIALSVRDLHVGFPDGKGGTHPLVRGVSFDVKRGTTLGLVGESGSGKTITALSILGLLPTPLCITQGSIILDQANLAGADEAGYKGIRGRRIALVSQEPMNALDPCFKVKTHLRGPLMRFRGLSRRAADAEALELLKTVGMRDPKKVYESYPHQLSGGMAQRVSIAWALAGQPDILIADEPTTALDVTVEAGILDLLRELQSTFDMSIVLVTHDLGVVADICTEVVVMRDGQIMEHAPVDQIFTAPQHPYTQSLLQHARALERDLGQD